MNWMRIALLILTIGIVGCGGSDDSDTPGEGSAVDAGNFDQVDVGMSVEEVEALIGPADSVTESLTDEMRLWTKPNGDGFAATFEEGKVTSTSSASKSY
ncbi:MAG: hypothetical protein AB8C95_11095 [Phycisphaeraceae bacterium]